MESEGSEDSHPVSRWGQAEDSPGADYQRRDIDCNRPTIVYKSVYLFVKFIFSLKGGVLKYLNKQLTI